MGLQHGGSFSPNIQDIAPNQAEESNITCILIRRGGIRGDLVMVLEGGDNLLVNNVAGSQKRWNEQLTERAEEEQFHVE